MLSPISNSRTESETILQSLSKEARFGTLVHLLEHNKHLAEVLDDQNLQLTFFAPTEDAFKHLKLSMPTKEIRAIDHEFWDEESPDFEQV